MKRIVVDARTLIQNTDGIGFYTMYFIKRLLQRFQGQFQICAVLPLEREDLGVFSKEERQHLQFAYSPQEAFGDDHRFDYEAWDKLIRSLEPDLYISTSFFSADVDCPQLVIIHDLVPLLFPDEFAVRENGRKAMFERLMVDNAQRADVLVGVSEHTANDVRELYPQIHGEIKILHPDVAYLIERTRERLDVEPEHHGRFLMIGVARPRKNVELVVEALKILKARGIDDCKVYFAGFVDEDLVPLPAYLEENELHDLAEILGYVPDEELYGLIRGSRGLLYPSHYEGFGMPVIEFLVAGKPVVCQDTSSLPEVGGELAFYCDDDPEQLAQLMVDVRHEQVVLPTADEIEAHLQTLVTRNTVQYEDVFNWIAGQLGGTMLPQPPYPYRLPQRRRLVDPTSYRDVGYDDLA